MEEPIKINVYGAEHLFIPEFGCYQVRDFCGNEMFNIALMLHENENTYVITVNLGEFVGIKNAAYFDINNCGKEMMDALVKAGVLQETLFSRTSGFVSYPLCLLTEDFITKYADTTYQKYSQTFDNYIKSFDPFETEQDDVSL